MNDQLLLFPLVCLSVGIFRCSSRNLSRMRQKSKNVTLHIKKKLSYLKKSSELVVFPVPALCNRVSDGENGQQSFLQSSPKRLEKREKRNLVEKTIIVNSGTRSTKALINLSNHQFRDRIIPFFTSYHLIRKSLQFPRVWSLQRTKLVIQKGDVLFKVNTEDLAAHLNIFTPLLKDCPRNMTSV